MVDCVFEAISISLIVLWHANPVLYQTQLVILISCSILIGLEPAPCQLNLFLLFQFCWKWCSDDGCSGEFCWRLLLVISVSSQTPRWVARVCFLISFWSRPTALPDAQMGLIQTSGSGHCIILWCSLRNEFFRLRMWLRGCGAASWRSTVICCCLVLRLL